MKLFKDFLPINASGLRNLKIILVFMTLFQSINVPLQAQVRKVWAVGDGEKIFKFDTDHFAENGNSIWNGKAIKLRGLYNEVLGFQIIVEMDSLGVEALEISITPPLHKKSGRAIGGSGNIRYGDKGSIEFFTQHYLNVTRPTKPHWFYGSENSAPEKMIGWIPDALIPSYAKQARGGFPVKVPPTEATVWRRQNELIITPRPAQINQGFWVDVYLPRDRNYPAGIYKSELIEWENGKAKVETPLEIEIINAYMPDENHSNVWVYNSGLDVLQTYFPELTHFQIQNMIKFEAHRHRVDLTGGFKANSSFFNEVILADYLPYLDGSAYTPQNGYHGPGQGEGEKIFPIGMYGRQVLGNTKESVQKESDKWVLWFEDNAPEVKYFWYMIDEPGPVQYPWIKERASWIKSNPGPGNKMPTHITTGYTEELKDEIDIWNAFDGVELNRLEELKQQGKDYWYYNGNRPRYGSFILEGTAVDMRINGWINYLYNINTWFVWESTHWTHNFQGPKGRLAQRVFNEPLTFINWQFEFGNGDGILFYPGRMPNQLQEDRGINLVIPSIRLKNIRRGQQDFELLWLFEQKVDRDKAKSLARQIVVKAMSEIEMTEKVAWSQRGDDYDRIRNHLLDILKK